MSNEPSSGSTRVSGVSAQQFSRPLRYPLWVRGDLDGFFGLMVDNLVQVLLIIDLCKFVAGLPDDLIYERVLPGAAISLLIGNIFYGLQGRWVARRTGNPETTALPYGINTPSVIAYALFIMGPIYKSTGDGTLAWRAGLLACLVSGLIEFFGAFFAERLRRVTPRAALLGVLAAVGIAFIAAEFAFRIYTRPLVGLAPLAFLLLAYFARHRFPLGLPGGLLAVLFGSLIAWGLVGASALFERDLTWFGGLPMSGQAVSDSLGAVHWIQPAFVGSDLWSWFWSDPDTNASYLIAFLTVSIPMGYINVLGSLQNIESAEAGGDVFHTGPSLAVNGLGSIAAGLFGSCFPTTIYIGHPGWKALGARTGYSILNGLFFTVVFLLGLGPFLRALIPIEAGAAIVLYIGIIITAQAFQATPKEHAPAVAIALFPALAALLAITLGNYFAESGAAVTLADVFNQPGPTTLYLPGLLTLTGANSGWILVTLFLAAIGAALIDRKYKAAAMWSGAATVLTLVGAMHAYRLDGNVIREYFIWEDRDQAAFVAAPANPQAAVATTPALAAGAAGPPALTTAAAAATPAALSPMMEPADASPIGAPTTASAAAGPTVVSYRAHPVVVGYALATALFAWAAWQQRRAAVRLEREIVRPAAVRRLQGPGGEGAAGPE